MHISYPLFFFFPKMDIFTLILIITLPIILTYHLYNKRKKTSIPLLPPSPPGLPLIGHLHTFATASNLHVHLSQLSKKHGPLMRMQLYRVPLLVVSSAELTKQLFKTNDLAFSGRPTFLGQQRLSYGGLDIAFAPYGDYWRELRKITAIHLFSLRKTQSFAPARAHQVSRMLARVSALALKGEAVNLSDTAMAFSSALICRIAFGRRCDEKESETRRFDELLHEAQALLASFFVSDYFPAFGWVDRLTGLIGRLDRAFERLDSFYQEVIDEHLDPNRPEPAEDDVLDTLIKLKEEKATSSVDLDWANIKALLMNIFLAATDTSAASIVWTMTALMKAPHVMERVQAEIRNTVGVNKGKVDEDDLPKLPYLKATINEAFRLHPAAPLLVARESIESCMLGGYRVEPKTMVYVNAWAVGRDPEYWECPDEFMPERFLNNNVDVRGQCYGLVPFGSGRRMCPGMLMGIVNVELAVANLLYSFHWEFPSGIEAKDVDMDVMRGLTMHKKNALLIVPKKYTL